MSTVTSNDITAASMKWKLPSLDITSAFLQGNKTNRDVFVKPPYEFSEVGKIWKLDRCLYGLNDAPCKWYNRVYCEVKALGGKTSLYDKALFLWHNKDGSRNGIVVTHVDDFVYCGTEQWHKLVFVKILKTY